MTQKGNVQTYKGDNTHDKISLPIRVRQPRQWDN